MILRHNILLSNQGECVSDGYSTPLSDSQQGAAIGQEVLASKHCNHQARLQDEVKWANIQQSVSTIPLDFMDRLMLSR